MSGIRIYFKECALKGGDVGEEGPGGGGAVGRDGARGYLQAAPRVHEPFVILEEGAVAVEFRGNRRCDGYAFQSMTAAHSENAYDSSSDTDTGSSIRSRELQNEKTFEPI